MKNMKRLLAAAFSAIFVFAMLIPAFAGGDQVLKEVRFTITEPQIGAAPDMVIVSAEPDKYTAKINYWLKQTVPDEKVEKFEAGYSYAVVFEVTPAEGYKFETPEKDSNGTAKSPTVVYLNGKETRAVIYEYENKLGRAYDWEIKENPVEETNFFIKIINAVKAFFAGIINFFKNL